MDQFPTLLFGYYPPRHITLNNDSDITMASPDIQDYDEQEEALNTVPELRRAISENIMNRNRNRTPPPRKAESADTYNTPLRSSMSYSFTAGDGVQLDPQIKAFLRNQYIDNVDREYPVIDFVKHVWKFTPSQIPTRVDEYQLPWEACLDYQRGVGERNPKTNIPFVGERGSYIHLEKIIDHLVATLNNRNPVVQGKFLKMRERVIQGKYTKYKPDWAFKHDLEAIKQIWESILAFGEIKKSTMNPYKGEYNPMIDLSLLKKPLIKRKMTSSIDTDDAPVAKRARVSTGQSHTARTKPETLNEHELQCAKYANEMLSHGTRFYATGFLIEDRMVSLFYTDRFGLVRSNPFDFMTEPHLFLLVLAAISAANLKALGICPFFEYPPESLTTYEDTKLNLPNAVDLEDNETGPLSFDVSVTSQMSVITAYGAIGRGCTVAPIKARDDETKKICGKGIGVAKMSWQPTVRRSEATLIRIIRRKLSQHDEGKRYLKHIVKMKCSMERGMDDPELGLPRAAMEGLRPYEDKIFRVLVLELYDPIENVKSPEEFKKVWLDTVRAHHWVWTVANILHRDISINNIMFHRKKNGSVAGILGDWDLAQERVDNTEGVERAVLAAVDGIDSESKQDSAKAASGDRANPGVKQGQSKVEGSKTGRNSAEQHAEKTTGVACEDEEAKAEDEEAKAEEERRKAKYRTGTGPFMAIELLLPDQAPLHLYRHDLESFFYVLVWFCAGFKPLGHRVGIIDDWQQPALHKIGAEKLAFIENNDRAAQIVSTTHSDYQPLLEEWAYPLRALLQIRRGKELEIQGLYHQMNRSRTTEELRLRLEKKINKLEKKRDRVVTYETFMEQIGETLG